MINGGLFAKKFEFKALNRHEGGRNLLYYWNGFE